MCLLIARERTYCVGIHATIVTIKYLTFNLFLKLYVSSTEKRCLGRVNVAVADLHTNEPNVMASLQLADSRGAPMDAGKTGL
jgi:hypothetical protein